MPSFASADPTNPESTGPILVIGAGLSGLAIGRLLTNNGVANTIFEASGRDRSQGFAISLHEWGYAPLLEALGGLSLRSMTKAVAPDRFIGGSGWVDLAMRDNTTGRVLVEPEADARPAVVRANRNALRAWIADCGDEDLDVRYGHKLKSVSGSIGNMRALFENGAEFRGSLVVAADGVHSAVRTQILPEIIPEIIPVVVYHGEFEVSRKDFDRYIRPLSGAANVLAGVGDGFNTPITICNITKSKAHLDWSYSRPARGTDDPLFNAPALSTDDQRRELDLPQALLNELALLNLAQPWSRYINPEAIKQHSVFHWVSRCVNMATDEALRAAQQGVVFVGDAWHAMPIFGGEGGNHALVDSVQLAAAIVGNSLDLESAVRAYYGGAGRRCQDAVRRSKSRFYVLHRPMAEWKDLAEKRRVKAVGG
ncbi:FAD-dependent monooxygenase nscC [Aspergillus undulatus]|uniref:FAD-dependent monooxygenase nscC n=1 Tax=Aspergillus undulatus TaxID=1810928 RepID=UPI003CCDDD16